MPLKPSRVLPRDMNARQWDLYIQGIQADSRVKTFQPTWIGFSADPVGVMSYLDFGALVVMWADDLLAGTSDATSFSLDGVPEEIRPRGTAVRDIHCLVLDSSNGLSGLATVNPDGTIDFSVNVTNVVANRISPALNGFTGSGTKGLLPGWILVYVK